MSSCKDVHCKDESYDESDVDIKTLEDIQQIIRSTKSNLEKKLR